MFKIRHLFICLMIALTACNHTDPGEDFPNNHYPDNPFTPNEGGGGSSGVGDATGCDLEDFDVVWDTSDLIEGTETIPTDSKAVDYDDYVENSTFNTIVSIVYSQGKVSISNSAEGVSISNNGAHVTINSTVKNIAYQISGEASDGSLKIYSSNKFKLELNGLKLTNPQGAAINIQAKKRAFIILNENTENVLTDGSPYKTVDGEDMKGCLFSEGKLIFSGNGSLTVNANYKHGICSDDYIRTRKGVKIGVKAIVGNGFKANDAIYIGGGIINMDISGDASKGLSSDSIITIDGGRTTIVTSGNGKYEDNDVSACAAIKSDDLFTMNDGILALKSTGTGGKGINTDKDIIINGGLIKVITTGKQYVYNRLDASAKGIKSDANITINGGSILVRVSGGNSSEGIESKNILTINNGNVEVFAYDDGINAAKNITITGGKVYSYSSNNDGIDSNGTLTISGGTVIASGTNTPEEGFDCDQNTFAITGGTLIGIGGASSTPTASQCTQPSIIYGGNGSANTYLNLSDNNGNSILTYKIPRSYQQMTLLISSSLLKKGNSYILSSGGSIKDGNDYHGLSFDASYSGGSQLASLTLSSTVTTSGTTGGFGGGGGGGRPKP